MHFSEIQQLIDQACDFPAEATTVDEVLGSVELTAPTGDSVTVREILPREGTTYHSAAELNTTIVGNLTDAFIGRKYYDDRAGVPNEDRVVVPPQD